ncbi:uncharacterized protein BKCO1_4600060 [Diplodia corticola]|uniref:Uncharacterized protein n=1 Tax=Diplodia corticola TaxID=236234 RepID=A0A1J9RVW5_9PEZI|nr:uncharacterized protein BKCO1_4600060 [Diplodia corticola]OJD31629.1 hypothetical protein BKCO1_4600060 [Diplodia corticola]
MGQPADLPLRGAMARDLRLPRAMGLVRWPNEVDGANGDTGWGSRALASKRQGNCILYKAAAMDVGARANGPQESPRGMRRTGLRIVDGVEHMFGGPGVRARQGEPSQ